MEGIKRKDRVCAPRYTLGEELVNAISHGIGAALSVAALVVMLLRARGPMAVSAVSVFGAAMIVLYTISCVYHSLSPRIRGKRVLRVLDHCSVFFLVLGTYVPVSLLGVSGARGWALLGVVFAFAAAGIALNAVSIEKCKSISVVCHLICGWSILAGIPQLMTRVGPAGVRWLLAGGVLYTLGAVLYGLGAKKRYIHSAFHFFCLLGTYCHFWCVYRYLL